ncbi:hypothetical protein P7K49_012193, partial [Saguinus oedipus]
MTSVTSSSVSNSTGPLGTPMLPHITADSHLHPDTLWPRKAVGLPRVRWVQPGRDSVKESPRGSPGERDPGVRAGAGSSQRAGAGPDGDRGFSVWELRFRGAAPPTPRRSHRGKPIRGLEEPPASAAAKRGLSRGLREQSGSFLRCWRGAGEAGTPNPQGGPGGRPRLLLRLRWQDQAPPHPGAASNQGRGAEVRLVRAGQLGRPSLHRTGSPSRAWQPPTPSAAFPLPRISLASRLCRGPLASGCRGEAHPDRGSQGDGCFPFPLLVLRGIWGLLKHLKSSCACEGDDAGGGPRTRAGHPGRRNVGSQQPGLDPEPRAHGGRSSAPTSTLVSAGAAPSTSG